MKKLLFIFLLFCLSSAVRADNDRKVRFAYDVDFEMRFDNREFYESDFSESMTVFGARLTPSVGLAVSEKGGAEHRLMLGVDMMKDFGASPVTRQVAGGDTDETSGRLNNLGLFRELLLYYKFEKQFKQTKMDIYAGIFPRSFMGGSYSEAFFSDSLKFYDNNLEGILMKFRRPKSYYEVGCDWMGKYGSSRREKFMVYSAGEGSVCPFMSIGYAGYMLHYANSDKAQGLVDNILLNPYVNFDFGDMTGMQVLSLRLGWLQAIQRDREYAGNFIYPHGVEFNQEVRKWNIGVHNKAFYGTDMMPYYNNIDNAGLKYGSALYYGDLFYRIHDNGSTSPGIYDRLELYYEPSLGEFLKIRVSALFHFHATGYSGCQQMISLRFNLASLLEHSKNKR